jgi:hypothetical protein
MPGTPVKLARQRLDAAGVTEHLRDLAQRATQIEARIKDTAAQTSAATSEPLDALARRLVTGDITGLQVRFFLDDAWWSDTILRAPDSFRLVRMREGD